MAMPVLTASQCAHVLRAMGDETRLRILELLLLSEQCVSDLVKELGGSQPHVSHHLRILREAGLVEGLREGQRICYRVAPAVRDSLRRTRRQALELGCCRISFPESLSARPVRYQGRSRV